MYKSALFSRLTKTEKYKSVIAICIVIRERLLVADAYHVVRRFEGSLSILCGILELAAPAILDDNRYDSSSNASNESHRHTHTHVMF